MSTTSQLSRSRLEAAGRAAALREAVGPERDVSNLVFKVLVLGTRTSEAFTGPLASQLPLSRREQDIPKARRPLIASIERALSNRDVSV